MGKSIRLAVLAIGFSVCPALFGVGYSWDFTGNAGANCTVQTNGSCNALSAGNGMTFNSIVTGGPTITASAWYIDLSGQLQKATLGRYWPGLGVCSFNESCTSPNHQVDNSGYDQSILFHFSAPIDPSTMNIIWTTGGDLDASYWLGGTSTAMNLTGDNVTTSLTALGFGAQNVSNGTANPDGRAVDLTTGVPAGYVNPILFGAKNGDIDDYFKIADTSGSTGSSAVPEPSSVILLFTVVALGLAAARCVKRSQEQS